MPQMTCAHCGVPIVDQTSMAEQGGKTYCCNNCLQMETGSTSGHTSGGATCAHCGSTIRDTSTQVERNGQTFCCNNCAMAMAQGVGQRGTMGSQQA